jgi:hypothetical protein
MIQSGGNRKEREGGREREKMHTNVVLTSHEIFGL